MKLAPTATMKSRRGLNSGSQQQPRGKQWKQGRKNDNKMRQCETSAPNLRPNSMSAREPEDEEVMEDDVDFLEVKSNSNGIGE